MMIIISAFLFIFCANLDNIVIGIAYGIKNIHIKLLSNLLIGLVTSMGTLVSMSVGKIISSFLPDNFANIIGSGFIILLGLYFILECLIKRFKKQKSRDLSLKDIDEMVTYAKESDLDSSGDINLKEAFFVGLGLSLNNIGAGIAASISGVNIWITTLFTLVISVVLIYIGELCGKKLMGKMIGNYASVISGILLIILGIIELFC